jgi:valyl-tRNA synthetase
MAAEKKFGKKFSMLPREEFLELCRKVLEESSLASTDSFLRLGISFNSYTPGDAIGGLYLTDSPEYRALTQETFVEMWRKGLIYEASRTNNYCPGCRTTVADAEVAYEELGTLFTDVRWKVRETGEEVVIGTTRPEFLATCAMVIYNPEDKRYQHLAGRHAIVPLYGKEVPIMAHPAAVMEKGTGLVMMCAFGDTADIRFFREQGLKPAIAIDPDGRMNAHAGFLAGLKVKEARQKVLDDLKARGFIAGQRHVQHRTPVCERSKDPIEFIDMPEFYVRQVEHKDAMLKMAQELGFHAPESRQILLDWIDAVSIDWPISRRRYYATEVPLWYCRACREAILPPPQKKPRYWQPWREPCPVKSCPKCGGKEFEGETRVFDTWFDSSISPLYILKWRRDPAFFERAKPCTLRPQGKEIIRTWLYYTLLKCYHLTGGRIFRDAWINYHVVDEHGEKMSKSLGNVIDPRAALDRFGAEPFRLWCAVEGDISKSDIRCSFERIDGAGKTINKLWNVCRFISLFPDAKRPRTLEPLDRWLLNEVNRLVKLAREGYEAYDAHTPSTAIRHFLWETLASHYLELVKGRAYNRDGRFTPAQQASAHWTLHAVLGTLLKLWAPVVPFITQKAYQALWGRDVHAEGFPEPGKEEKFPFTADDLMALDGAIWKAKRDAKQSLRTTLAELVLPEKFRDIAGDLQAAHAAQKVGFGKELKVVLAPSTGQA